MRRGEFFEEKLGGAEWVSVSNQFFATLVTPLIGEGDGGLGAKVRVAQEPEGQPEYGIEGAMGMPGFQVQPGQTATLRFQLYIGPKLYHRLAKLQHDEAEIMNFGIFKIVSQVLLNFLNLFHSLLRNYAAAIIVLTAFVKLRPLAAAEQGKQVDAPHGRALAQDAGADAKSTRTTRRG